jgi:uncharacterized protein YdaL
LKRLGAGAAILAIVAALVIGMRYLAPAPPAPAPAPARAALDAKPPPRLLVLYQTGPNGPGSGFAALMTANLLGRFGAAKIADLDAYKAADAEGVQALFVLPAFGGARPPQALLDEVRAGRRPVVWIQHGAKWLAQTPAEAAALGWRPGPPGPRDYVQVRYKGQSFLRDPRDRAAVAEPEVLDAARVAVLATVAARDGRQAPWALRSGSLTYVAEAPYAYTSEDDRYLVFADLLFRTLAPQTPPRHRAMVRIEDVGPEADPATLRKITDVLHDEGVPFSIAVYDSYADPNGHYHDGAPVAFTLADRPALVRALKRAERRGAMLIAHGHTHQYANQPNPYFGVSGGDYEFFKASLTPGSAFLLEGPLPHDSLSHWQARIADLRAGWRRAGLAPPSVFTTPHYAASLNAYAALRRSFPVRYERVTYFPGEGTGATPDQRKAADQYFPFETVDSRGDFIVPENLGFGSDKRGRGDFGRSPEEMIATARRNLVVQDGFASFFYHWYEDPERLRRTVRGIKALGYTFVTPREVVAQAPAYMRAGRALAPPQPRAAPSRAGSRAIPRMFE